MNHKRRRAPHQRAGCKMCKPNKDERNKSTYEKTLGHTGFGKIRGAIHANEDLKSLS